VTNGKPHPEIFEASAARFDPAPTSAECCLVFEDAPTGVEAARAAGMACVMVPDANLDRAMCNGASLVLGSLEAFAPEEWGLPAFGNAA
jgi:beta-phosphoglucomutase-like phosphatase (HAD superfamily)